MKIMYIEKMDKPKRWLPKIKIEHDNLKLGLNLNKEKNIKKVVNKLIKNEIVNGVLSKDLYENKDLINGLNAHDINIFEGRWLERYLAIQILDYIVVHKGIKKEEVEIAVTVNQITDLSIEIIKVLAKQYKKLTVITNYIDILRKILINWF